MKEEQIFHEALEVVAERRAAVLDEACGQDIDLRRRVEILLEAHANPGSFLGSPPPAVRVEQTLNQPSLEKRGTQVGPYKLLEQIGEGGFGVVYMAEQVTPVRRKVALKIIKPGMDTRQVIARFEAERQALSLMDHPNIAKVLDAGTTDSGRPYFVMELVKGQPITHYCDEKLLTPRQRLELLLPVCHAIQHAHQKGIIHRDIKPTNILVAEYDQQPVPKVIDFGVAKATGSPLSEKTMFTGFGQIVGTLEYMSPEQAKVNQLDIDTRSDIYSLGVLLYELLTGATPFDKERLRSAAWDEMLRIIREEEPPRPSTKLSSSETLPSVAANRGTEPARLTKLVRGELDWIVMKALEKDRNRRYETANGFAMDVQRYLADEPVQACPPSTAYRLRKFVRRNKGPVLAAALVALALVGGIIGTAWGLIRATDEAGQKTVALGEARDNLWLSLYEQARARRFSRQMGQRLDSLNALAKAAAIRPDERLRDAASAAMALPDVRLGPPWQASTSGYKLGNVDGQYRLFARVSEKGVISTRSLPDDREIQSIVSAPTRRSVLLLSPDGRYLANVEDGDTLKVWRVADRAAVLREEPRQTFGWAFSPDSRQLAIGQQGWVLRFDLATGQELNRWQLPEKRRAHALAFHPDNRRLAVGYDNASFASVYDATTGELVANLPVGVNIRQAVAWHPDGDRLAVAGSDPRIHIWNVSATREVATLEGHVQDITDLSFHPDGSLLASGSWDGSARLWDPATGRQLLQFSLAAGRIRFSSDGRWLGFTMHGEQAQLLEVTPTPEYRTLVSRLGAGQGTYHSDSDISPDGRLLALSTGDRVRLWHLPSGREMAVLPDGRPLFQSNGELLIAGPGGLHRWPIQPGKAANELRLGPPRVLALPAVPERAARSQDSRTLAIVSETGGTALLVDLATDSVRAPRFNHASAAFVALSRDGRWLATSGWHSDRVRLWNAETGKMVQEWVLGAQLRVFFMPDSRVLIISRGDEFCFHDVQTLKPIRRIRRDVAQYPGHVAFSRDGKLMALEMAPGIIHLKDAATDRTVARLEDPHGDRSGWMGFTPDGTQLVVNAPFAQAVHIWDLRAIRQRLKGMGLDWDWPEFPPTAAKDALPALVKIEVDPGRDVPQLNRDVPQLNRDVPQLNRDVPQLNRSPRDAWFHLNQGVVLGREGKLEEAITPLRKAIELDPIYAPAHNALGNVLLHQGKLDQAIACYQKAIELDPKDAIAYSDLGLALTEQGKLDAAIACYQKAIELDPKRVASVNNQIKKMKKDKDFEVLSGREDFKKLVAALEAKRPLNERAWELATNPDPALRDPARAVALAEQAVAEALENSDYWTTLGVARYRVGDFSGAVSALRKSRTLRRTDAEWSNPFFLAMAHWQLGQTNEALEWHARAVGWMEWKQAKSDAMLRFRAEAEEMMGAVSPEAIAAELSRNIEHNPTDAGIYRARGTFLVGLGRSRDAVADFDKALELKPNDHWHYYQAAALYLHVGDIERYRGACRALLDQAEKLAEKDPGVAEFAAKTCALAPESVHDFARVERLAERCVTGTESSPYYRFYILAKGLTDYRGDRHGQAIELLRARFAPGAQGNCFDGAAFAGLAMAHHRLGQADQARASLACAGDIIATKPNDWWRETHWQAWLHCEILFREAEGLIGVLSPEELAAERLKRWDHELADLSRQAEDEPASATKLAAKAKLLLVQGRFEEADGDYERLARLAPADHWHWYYRACLLAYLEREQDYREHCRAMLVQFADSADAAVLDRTTKAALLLPHAIESDAPALIPRAERTLKLAPESPWSFLLMGIAQYRAGRPSDAIPWLEKSREANAPARTAAADAFLAMSYHRLGRHERAEAVLTRCVQLIEQKLPKAGVRDLDRSTPGVENWLIAHTARREADRALKSDESTVDQ